MKSKPIKKAPPLGSPSKTSKKAKKAVTKNPAKGVKTSGKKSTSQSVKSTKASIGRDTSKRKISDSSNKKKTVSKNKKGVSTKGLIELSEEQEKVVNHRGGHLQVIACAGAGKTEAIARRVSSLIEEGVDPSQIVAFTFTERAATSLKTRINSRVSQVMGDQFLDRLSPMFVGTIHGYCWRLLQDHVPRFGDFDILDDNRLAGFLSREYKNLQLDKLNDGHWRAIDLFIRNANIIENELIEAEKVESNEFCDCYVAYKKALSKYHFITYGLLITASIRALTDKSTGVFERVHSKLRHLIVDEYQDTNPAQEKLIGLLARSPVELCVVADDDQSIYQWRGSDVKHMIEFKNRYRPVKSLTLSTNRRSRPRIIEKANGFAESICPRLPKRMNPHREKSDLEFHTWTAETPSHEAEVIANTIEGMVKSGLRYKDIAILFRSVRTSSADLIRVFEDRKIPFRCGGRSGLFLQPEACILGKTYAWLIDNEWKSERYDDSEFVDLIELIDEYNQLFNAGKTIRSLESHLIKWKAEIAEESKPANLVRDLYRLFYLLGVQRLDPENPAFSARMGCLAGFSKILADFEHVKRRSRYVNESEFQGGQNRGIHFYRQLFNYLQFHALESYESFGGEESIHVDAVDILTTHRAKGLEWSIVFLPSLVDGRFPSSKKGRKPEYLLPDTVFPSKLRERYEGTDTDERRLFYVALTRAKDIVYLSNFVRIKNRRRQSPYMIEVQDNVSRVTDKLPLPNPPPRYEEHQDSVPTISFSDLAAYEECPFRYRLSTSIGFQPQLETELGYGKAIHHVLRRLSETSRINDRLPTDKEVLKVINETFYLPFAQKGTFEVLKAEATKIIRKYLGEYSSDLKRVWETERHFELNVDNGIVSGRADVILDMEGGRINSLALVDYKTASDTSGDDIHAFQLAVYAAAGRGEGLNVTAAYLHNLKTSKRMDLPVEDAQTNQAKERASKLISGIIQKDFPAKPEKSKCTGCDMRNICKYSKGGKGC